MSNGSTKRRSAQQTGCLRLNMFRQRGFGLIKPDDGGKDIFCHITDFRGVSEEDVYNLEHRRRLSYRLAVDPRGDRIHAVAIRLLDEILAPDGVIIELEADAESESEKIKPRPAAFGELVAAIN